MNALQAQIAERTVLNQADVRNALAAILRANPAKLILRDKEAGRSSTCPTRSTRRRPPPWPRSRSMTLADQVQVLGQELGGGDRARACWACSRRTTSSLGRRSTLGGGTGAAEADRGMTDQTTAQIAPRRS